MSKRKTTAQFIQDARKIHGDKYDYSNVDYVNCDIKVKIICPKHGEFLQAPTEHLSGKGCAGCNHGGFSPFKPATIYFLKFRKSFATFWKIGVTNHTIEKRFGSEAYAICERHEWRLEMGVSAYKIEQAVLKRFQKYKFGTDFLFNLLESKGSTECFKPNLPARKVCNYIERLTRTI